MMWEPVDWGRVFVPSAPIVETIVRGTVVYLSLLALLRFVLRRESGTTRLSMLLLVVLLADAVQNAMAADHMSVTDGLVLVGTIMAWDHALEWLAWRVPRLQTLVHPPPLVLVRDGRILRHNMRRELVSDEELWSGLRMHGVERLGDVRRAYMEGDGRLSVIRRDGDERSDPGASNRRAVAR
jgi:uncharacterized membrane protein YcaP (DUF421 family)